MSTQQTHRTTASAATELDAFGPTLVPKGGVRTTWQPEISALTSLGVNAAFLPSKSVGTKAVLERQHARMKQLMTRSGWLPAAGETKFVNGIRITAISDDAYEGPFYRLERAG